MLRFDNAFMCKSGFVGMQFVNQKGAIISIFHDGKELKITEGLPLREEQEIYKKYFQLRKYYQKPQNQAVMH